MRAHQMRSLAIIRGLFVSIMGSPTMLHLSVPLGKLLTLIIGPDAPRVRRLMVPVGVVFHLLAVKRVLVARPPFLDSAI